MLAVGQMFAKEIEDTVKFDSAFWDYYDTHITHIVWQQRNIDAPCCKEETPKDCRKQRESEQLQQEMEEMLYCTVSTMVTTAVHQQNQQLQLFSNPIVLWLNSAWPALLDRNNPLLESVGNTPNQTSSNRYSSNCTIHSIRCIRF